MPNGYVDHSSAAKQELIIRPTWRGKALGSTLEVPYTLVFILLFPDFAEIVSKFHSYFFRNGDAWDKPGCVSLKQVLLLYATASSDYEEILVKSF